MSRAVTMRYRSRLSRWITISVLAAPVLLSSLYFALTRGAWTLLGVSALSTLGIYAMIYRPYVEWDDRFLASNATQKRWRISFADVSSYERQDKVKIGEAIAGKRPGLKVFTYGGGAHVVSGEIFSRKTIAALAARLDEAIAHNLGEPSAVH